MLKAEIFMWGTGGPPPASNGTRVCPRGCISCRCACRRVVSGTHSVELPCDALIITALLSSKVLLLQPIVDAIINTQEVCALRPGAHTQHHRCTGAVTAARCFDVCCCPVVVVVAVVLLSVVGACCCCMTAACDGDALGIGAAMHS